MEEVKLWIPWSAEMANQLFETDFHQLFLKKMMYDEEYLYVQFWNEKKSHLISIKFTASCPFRCIPLNSTMDVDEFMADLMEQANVSAPITPFFMRKNSEFIRYYLEQDSIFNVPQNTCLTQYTFYAWHNLIDVVTWEDPEVEIRKYLA